MVEKCSRNNECECIQSLEGLGMDPWPYVGALTSGNIYESHHRQESMDHRLAESGTLDCDFEKGELMMERVTVFGPRLRGGLAAFVVRYRHIRERLVALESSLSELNIHQATSDYVFGGSIGYGRPIW